MITDDERDGRWDGSSQLRYSCETQDNNRMNDNTDDDARLLQASPRKIFKHSGAGLLVNTKGSGLIARESVAKAKTELASRQAHAQAHHPSLQPHLREKTFEKRVADRNGAGKLCEQGHVCSVHCGPFMHLDIDVRLESSQSFRIFCPDQVIEVALDCKEQLALALEVHNALILGLLSIEALTVGDLGPVQDLYKILKVFLAIFGPRLQRSVCRCKVIQVKDLQAPAEIRNVAVTEPVLNVRNRVLQIDNHDRVEIKQL